MKTYDLPHFSFTLHILTAPMSERWSRLISSVKLLEPEKMSAYANVSRI